MSPLKETGRSPTGPGPNPVQRFNHHQNKNHLKRRGGPVAWGPGPEGRGEEGQGDPRGIPGQGRGHGQGHGGGGGGALPEKAGRAPATRAMLGAVWRRVSWGPYVGGHPGSLQGQDHGHAVEGPVPSTTGAGGRCYPETPQYCSSQSKQFSASATGRADQGRLRSCRQEAVLAEKEGAKDAAGSGG